MSSQPPIVAIHNNLETFYPFLSRADDPALFQKRKYRGDRALFWHGDPKLVFVTAPVPDAHLVCNRWGYPQTSVSAPEEPTHQLCLNILREPALLERIVDYAGLERTVRLVPYATTPELFQLAETLRTGYHLTVLLPESPDREHLWVRDYADSKSGFRSLATQWLGEENLFPEGFVCRDPYHAGEVVTQFLHQDRACVVKADGGESGIGHIVFEPGVTEQTSALSTLEANPFLCGDLIIVEEYIQASNELSPSLEYFVPPSGAGEPRLTYVSRQMFSSFGRFDGVMISRDMQATTWYARMVEHGLRIAGKLQQMGYVGHFDIDTVMNDRSHPYFLELNARRTGGTFVHEFACHTFGQDYLERTVILSKNSVDSGGITDTIVLLEWLGDLLYPDYAPDGGVVVTVTSTLVNGEFGCILVAANEAEMRNLDLALRERMQVYLE